jgi:hypothetical protein
MRLPMVYTLLGRTRSALSALGFECCMSGRLAGLEDLPVWKTCR